MDTAVMVFPLPRSAISEEQTLRLSAGEAWQHVVRFCRRGIPIPDTTLEATYDKAACVIGPISENAQEIDTCKREAQASRFQQWAFTEDFAEEVFQKIIDSGSVHVFRTIHENKNKW